MNIPMDLGTGGRFTSDIDIVARLHDYPRSDEWFYKTWEVKVSLLLKDGTARSLKAGKVDKLVRQLNAYREFGSPDVGLLDVYLCEAGFLRHNPFPPPALNSIISAKKGELAHEGFGYQLLFFEHDRDEAGNDVGLYVPGLTMIPLKSTIDLLVSSKDKPRQPFLRFAGHLHNFFESASNCRGKNFHQIVFCRACRTLQLIRMRDCDTCPSCQQELVIQH